MKSAACWIALLCTLPLLALGQSVRPHIVGLSHVAFFVHDIEKSRAFYEDFLGFAEPYSVTNKNGSLHLIWIKINDRQTIELFPEKEASTDRLNHIALQTDDAEAMRLYLASKGLKVPDHTPIGKIKNANYLVKDPDGHDVEIVQYMPDSWTRREQGKFLPDTRISARMRHAGILVGKLDPALKFYCEILGCKETWRGGGNPKKLSWVNVQVPDGDDYIEFMLYSDFPSPDKLGSKHHISLEVPDIEKARSILEKRAAASNYTKPLDIQTGVNRKRQLNLYDPDGTRVELMEPKTVDGVSAPSSTAPPPS